MAGESTEPNVVAQIPEGIAKVNSFLEGLNGQNDIMQNLGERAIKEKVITFSEKKPADNTEAAPIVEAAKPNETAAAEKNDDNKPGAETDKPVTETEKPVIEFELSEEDQKNPFLKNKKTAKSDFKFENIDQVKEAAKKTLGIEIKNESDFGKVFSSALKWREDAQKLTETQERLVAVEELLENAPESVINALKAYYSGDENWASPILNMPKFDFSKPVEKQDIKTLVNNYFPNQFTQDDWDAEDKPKALQIAETAAKEKFIADKRELESQSATQIKDANTRKDARIESISSSLTVLTQSFPDLDKTDIKDIQKVMESGDVNSLFFNKNGSFKPDAAKKIMMALYGESAIKNLTKMAEKRAESKANEDILTRAADNAKPARNSGDQNGKVNAETIKKVSEFTSGINRKTTY